MELESKESKNNNASKNFDLNNDVIILNKKIKHPLFDGYFLLSKPFDGVNSNYTIHTSEDSDFHVNIKNIIDKNSGQSVLSYINNECKKTDYVGENFDNNSLMYYSICNLVYGQNQYFVDDGFTSQDINSFFLISMPRQNIKDGIDEKAFTVFLHNVNSSNSVEQESHYYDMRDVSPLYFKNVKAKSSDYGKKKYLYMRDKSGDTTDDKYYNSDTDEINYNNSDKLRDKLVGEVFLEHGVILLFPELLKLYYNLSPQFDFNGGSIELDSLLHSIGGISHINTTVKKFYIRVLNNEFKYSNNPTAYDDVNQEIYKEFLREDKFNFITKIDFLNSNDETIAQATTTSPILNEVGSEINITANLISY